MKKITFAFLLVTYFLMCWSCSEKDDFAYSVEENTVVEKTETQYVFREGQTVLGDVIDIPYSIENLKRAMNSLPPETRSSVEKEIVPTHLYVRFHPKNEYELSILKNNEPRLILSEVPLDREIIISGTSYHDPNLPEDMPTYQYSVLPVSFCESFLDSLSVENMVLLEAYMPEETEYFNDTKTECAISKLLQVSYSLCGAEYQTVTKSSDWRPHGRIMAYDNVVGGFVPVPRVRIRGSRFLNIKETLTDDDGYYTLPSFNGSVSMKIIWESNRWDIRDGNIGQAVFDGPKVDNKEWNVSINNGTSRTLRYATIQRAASRYYYANIEGLDRPQNSRKEKIAYIHDEIDNGSTNGDYSNQYGCGIWSDIRIAGKNVNGWRDISMIFSTTCHELGHLSHRTNAKDMYNKSENRVIESWARFVQYFLTLTEYKELGVLNVIYPNGLNSFNPQYDFQYTSSQEYTTLFIDLYDKYDQGHDRISDFPPAAIQELLYKCSSFIEIKSMLTIISALSPEAPQYGITDSSVEDLFSIYKDVK